MTTIRSNNLFLAVDFVHDGVVGILEESLDGVLGSDHLVHLVTDGLDAVHDLLASFFDRLNDGLGFLEDLFEKL